MGAIIAKFRKKKSTIEILESLESNIKEIEEFKLNTELQRRKIVGRLVLFSVLVYIVAALLFYFKFFPANLYDQLLYIIPLLLFPIIVVSIKRVLTWYYTRKIRRNQEKLASMKEEKKKLLDKVMDTETYKVAKTILEKFAPDQLRRSNNLSTDLSVSVQSVSGPNKTPLKQLPGKSMDLQVTRTSPVRPQGTGQTPMAYMRTPVPYTQSMAFKTPLPMRPGGSNMRTQQEMTPMPLPLPRTILPRERSTLDKMVEYLVGDGPSNRFALICKSCQSHNGMALREEFEYIGFRCCYCYHLNPARKLRPSAPKLESDISKLSALSDKSTSESEQNSPSDTESEKEIKVDEKIQNSDTESFQTENKESATTEEKCAESEEQNVDEKVQEKSSIEKKID